MGGLVERLTKTGLDYGPGQETYFDSAPAAGVSLARQAAASAQPATATIGDNLPEPSVVPGREMLSGPVEGSLPTADYVPGESPKVGMRQPGAGILPRLVKPSFSEASTDASGMPAKSAPGLTRLGKLFQILGLAGQGAAAGQAAMEANIARSGGHYAGGFGTGLQAGITEPARRAEMQQAIQRGAMQNQQEAIQTQMAQENLQPVATPWGAMPMWRAKQTLGMQKDVAELRKANLLTPGSGGVYDIAAGKQIVGPAEKEGNPDLQTFNDLTSKVDPTLGRPLTPIEATQRIAETKQAVKPEPAKAEFQQLASKFSPEVTPAMMTSLAAYTAGIDRSKLLNPAEKQKLKGYVQTQGTPMSQGTMANLRIEGLGSTRGVQQVQDTKTGNIGPVTWEELNRAAVEEPGRYQSPQFGQTGQRMKFLQAYEDPKGRASINRQAINNIMQHAGDLSQLNRQYERSNVKIINTPINKIAEQFGSEAYTDFATTTAVLKDELGLYFAGGYAPQGDQIARWNKILADEMPPSGVEAFAKEVIHLGLRRATTFNEQYKKNMGTDDPNMLVPEAVAAGEQLGLGDEVKKFGSGGQYGTDIYGAKETAKPGTQKRSIQPTTAPRPTKYAPGFSPM